MKIDKNTPSEDYNSGQLYEPVPKIVKPMNKKTLLLNFGG